MLLAATGVPEPTPTTVTDAKSTDDKSTDDKTASSESGSETKSDSEPAATHSPADAE
jgi:hypothetical protein